MVVLDSCQLCRHEWLPEEKVNDVGRKLERMWLPSLDDVLTLCVNVGYGDRA